ncbi:MAG: hypothetical protein NT007_04225 [Candidatus Kapabacteria bacterium]|nr:hypothetical protein [Candidatus Kapabacteria bacterium]
MNIKLYTLKTVTALIFICNLSYKSFSQNISWDSFLIRNDTFHLFIDTSKMAKDTVRKPRKLTIYCGAFLSMDITKGTISYFNAVAPDIKPTTTQGSGFSCGLAYLYPIGDSLLTRHSIAINLLLSRTTLTFNSPSKNTNQYSDYLTAIPTDPNQIQYCYSNDLSMFKFESLFNLKPFNFAHGGPEIMFGPCAVFSFLNNTRETLKINPSNTSNIRFTKGMYSFSSIEDNGKTMIVRNSTLPGSENLKVYLKIGLNYEIRIIKNTFIFPYISYNHDLYSNSLYNNDMVNHNYSFGISIVTKIN